MGGVQYVWTTISFEMFGVLNIKLKIISLRVVLTSATNNSILHEAGFLDAFLIDLVQLKF